MHLLFVVTKCTHLRLSPMNARGQKKKAFNANVRLVREREKKNYEIKGLADSQGPKMQRLTSETEQQNAERK